MTDRQQNKLSVDEAVRKNQAETQEQTTGKITATEEMGNVSFAKTKKEIKNC